MNSISHYILHLRSILNVFKLQLHAQQVGLFSRGRKDDFEKKNKMFALCSHSTDLKMNSWPYLVPEQSNVPKDPKCSPTAEQALTAWK